VPQKPREVSEVRDSRRDGKPDSVAAVGTEKGVHARPMTKTRATAFDPVQFRGATRGF